MSGRFTNKTLSVITPLDELRQQLRYLAESYHNQYDHMQRDLEALLAGDEAFRGLGATALGEACHTLLADLTERIAILSEAVYACLLCVNALQDASANADSIVMNDLILSRIMEELNPLDVMRDGAAAVDAVLARVAQDLANDINAGLNWIAMEIGIGGQLLADLLKLGPIIADDLWEFLNDVARHVRDWANEVQATALRWKNSITYHWERLGEKKKIDYSKTISSPSEALRTINDQYTQNRPIGISILPSGALLVTLAGLQILNIWQTNNILSAGESGMGISNAYEQDVRTALKDYIKDHPEIKQPVHVKIMGHSMGGIVGQQLLDANGPGQAFTVDDVVTFGSPMLHADHQHVQGYFTQFDQVPYLSPNELVRTAPFNALPGGSVGGIPILGNPYLDLNPNVKAAYLGETYIPVVGHNAMPFADHGAYFDKADASWIDSQPMPFQVGGGTGTEFYRTHLDPSPDDNNK